MALPFTISTATGVGGHHPPFKSSGGNFYTVIRDLPSRSIDVFKASDPASSWTAQDTGANPVDGADSFTIISAVQNGDVIYIATAQAAAEIYRYHEFNMADDTWSVTMETIEDVSADPPDQDWVSIGITERSSTKVPVVVYNGLQDTVHGGPKERVDANVRTGGTWDGPIALDAAGDIHYGNPNIIKGPLTDDIHISFKRETNTADPPALYQIGQARTLRLDNSLSTLQANNLSNENLLSRSNMVSYDDASTQRIAWVESRTTGSGSAHSITSWRAVEDGSDDISSVTLVEATTDDPFVNGEVGIIAIAELDGGLHVLFSGGGTAGVDQDLWYMTSTDDGATYSTPTEELDAVTVNFISANVYVRGSDTVLAYIYDDGGDQKYNEKVLIAGGNLDATVALAFAKSNADLKAKGKLDATAALVFAAPTVDLADATGGAISATVPMALALPTTDLKAKGKLDATAALALAFPSADLKAKGKLDATSALALAFPSADLKAKGKLDATSALALAFLSADLNATGKLDAIAALVFGAPVVDLIDASAGAISATSALALAFLSADLKGKGKLDATVALIFLVSVADLKAKGKLDATAALALTFSSADLNAKGKLDATSALALAFPSADLNAKGKLDATAALVFGAPVVDLVDGSGAISATSALALAFPSADLKGRGKLDAMSALALAFPSADLNATGKLDATSALALAFPSVDLTGKGKLDGTLPLILGFPTVDLKGKGKLDATSALALAFPSVDLTGKGKLDAIAALVFGAPVVNLVDAVGGAISATASLAFAAPSVDLKAKGLLSASVPMSFTITANLSDASILVFPFVGRHIGPFMLDFIEDLVS